MVVKEKSKSIKIIAPGRVCLFGDHQDYLGLPVIACTIDRQIELLAIPNKEAFLRIELPDTGEERIIDIRQPIVPSKERDFFISALKVLAQEGCVPNYGFDIKISGNIPINAGLSSSSALVVIWVSFLLEAFDKHKEITRERIAALTYQAEVLEYNDPGGLMDQYTISLGGLLFLNTLNGTFSRIDKQINALIIGESGISKQTLGILGKLRGMALAAINAVKEQVPDFNIENAVLEDYENYKHLLGKELQPIFYAAINNYEITKKAYKEFTKEKIDITNLGNLMNQHHQILKDILKITVPVIDNMIEAALLMGALGAKIVGSGGGGSVVVLANTGEEEIIIKALLEAGAKAAYKVAIAPGVTVI